MRFHELELKGAFVIELDLFEDERGFFARTWCAHEFEEHGLEPRIAQSNLSYNRSRGTLRGMHLQLPPRAETKVVHCFKGSVFDVILDLRPESATFGKWTGVTISDENRRAVYVPRGFAHGFQTLADNTDVYYEISEFYSPEHSRGIRWNDPRFGIIWPLPISVMSAKDRSYADFAPADFAMHTDAPGAPADARTTAGDVTHPAIEAAANRTPSST